MRKLSVKDFKPICLGILASFAVGGFSYLGLLGNQKKISSRPSVYGGYIGDGDMSYCKKLNDRILIVNCKLEHEQNLHQSYPFILPILCFGLIPLGFIVIYLFTDEFS